MGSIRGKLLFGLECLVQTLEHMIKLVCKLMEFIFAVVQFDTLLQVISSGNMKCSICNLSDRF